MDAPGCSANFFKLNGATFNVLHFNPNENFNLQVDIQSKYKLLITDPRYICGIYHFRCSQMQAENRVSPCSSSGKVYARKASFSSSHAEMFVISSQKDTRE